MAWSKNRHEVRRLKFSRFSCEEAHTQLSLEGSNLDHQKMQDYVRFARRIFECRYKGG
jgi:hypothetical protein